MMGFASLYPSYADKSKSKTAYPADEASIEASERVIAD